MRTIRLTIEYEGTRYSGWQIQPRKATVQQLIQDALRRVTQEKVDLVGASRTDAGVHALGQTAHFRTSSLIPCGKLRTALNGLLPDDIAIRDVRDAGPSFHAITGAKEKIYRYLIWNSKTRSALWNGRAWHLWAPLDVTAMRKAAKYLRGRHDFSAFRAHQSDTKTSVRRIDSVKIGFARGEAAGKQKLLRIEIAGNGFLKYMVRNIVGTLVEVGKGRFDPDEFKRILLSRDRKKAGATAPAFGLYLVSVRYTSSGGGMSASPSSPVNPVE